MTRPLARPIGLLPLLTAVAAPALPDLPAGGLLLLCGLLWWGTRPTARESWAVLPLLLGAAALFLAHGVLNRLPEPPPEEWREKAEERYQLVWRGLAEESESAAKRIPTPSWDRDPRRELFQLLGSLVTDARPGLTLMVVDPAGEAVAWEGRGLSHEPVPESIPRQGFAFRAGFASVTILSVRPLSPEDRPWRLVAGRVLPVDHLPFRAPGRRTGEVVWSLVDDPGEVAESAETVLAAPGAPYLALTRVPGAPSRQTEARRHRQMGWLLVGLALLSLAVMRGVGLAILQSTAIRPADPPVQILGLLSGGVLAWGLAAGVEPFSVVLLVVVTSILGLAYRSRYRVRTLAAAVGGAGGALSVAALAWGYQRQLGPVDLAEGLLDSSAQLALRAAIPLLALGVLRLTGGRGDSDRVSDRASWLPALVLVAASACSGNLVLSLLLLAVGGGLAAVLIGATAGGPRVAGSVIVACILGAVAWELAYRVELQRHLGQEVLNDLRPPDVAEVESLRLSVERAFSDLDLDGLAPRKPEGLQGDDLPYVLWRRLPLPKVGSLSAVAVAMADGREVRFSYGLPLQPGFAIDPEPARWRVPVLDAWGEAMVRGDFLLRSGGEPWGWFRVWWLPGPGFRLGFGEPASLGTGLLRKDPGVGGLVPLLPPPALFALYDESGRSMIAPWPEAPPLEGVDGESSVETPVGTCWAISKAIPGGTVVIFVPVLDPWQSLERMGYQVLAALLLLGLCALIAAVLALPRAAFRDVLKRAVRSYSKRLILVYSGLLLVPLLLLHTVLSSGMEERLRREQRVSGRLALQAARQVLGEFLLTLEPGFVIETELDDGLLEWLSRAVHHEVNLYWDSKVYASAKRELFSGGLLPERIPGGAYSRLALDGLDLSSRTNRAGRVSYLELYAPLRVPGIEAEEERLFLSLPMVAREEEIESELTSLRRQSSLLTAALFLVAAAVGMRLARSFTQPIQQLVEGTRRIASGAPSLDLRPTELELAALVEAIDEMARRIADGRRRLLREKRVVEGMVENITSGVVSLDRNRRVLMRNRVALDLLEVEVGEELDVIARRHPAVAGFLAKVGGSATEATVRLPGEEGEEREWRLVWVPLPGPGEPTALLVVDDATEVLRAQRLEAWAEMARIIAHEIKNPLTPIRLSAEHMKEVYGRDPDHFEEVFERCTSNILRQVKELQSISAEFSAYSRIPRLLLTEGDLTRALEELVESYRVAPPRGVDVTFRRKDEPLSARFDEKMLPRAVRNLLENAIRACADGGTVTLHLEQDGPEVLISVLDSGPGVDPGQLPRIFEPYFSTDASGTGLGLPIAKRVVEGHGGTIAARNHPGGGLEVTIRIPM